MTGVSTTESERTEPPATAVERLGGWLFKRRTWLPVPLALAVLLSPPGPLPAPLLVLGAGLVAGGEVLRLWAVRHIGVVSRTRSQRLGPLVSSGPFEYVRNPLYIGNVLLWAGFALSAGAIWLTPLIVLILGASYHAVVRWEEGLLAARLGDNYRTYIQRVPRWIPSPGRADRSSGTRPSPTQFSWRETLFSERGTLIAIVIACVLVWVKLRLAARS